MFVFESSHTPTDDARRNSMKGNRSRAIDVHLLAKAFFAALRIDDCEYGGIGLDCKRPFGNSDADADILEIIGAEPEFETNGGDDEPNDWSEEQRDYASSLYHEDLIPYLQSIWAEWDAS
jgi:hypothetical protein